jgi:cytochrome b pre-mRNA-processing protein 3
MVLTRFFGSSRNPALERRVYEQIVEQARRPVFYREFGVPDSLDGRFEMIILHAFLVLRRLKAEPRRTSGFSQRLFDVMFADLDRSLREMGVGDLGVGKHVKRMAKAFFGRVQAYEDGLDRGEAVLCEALGRNLYGTVSSDRVQRARAGRYCSMAARLLAETEVGAILEGRVRFPEPDLIRIEAEEGERDDGKADDREGRGGAVG